MTHRSQTSDGEDNHVASGPTPGVAFLGPIDAPVRRHYLRRRMAVGVGVSALALAVTVIPSNNRHIGGKASPVAATDGTAGPTSPPALAHPAIQAPDPAPAPPTTTTDSPTPLIPSPASTETVPDAAKTPTTHGAPSAVRRSNPTPAPLCRNSTDSRCGAFAWDPAPEPNQPLSIALEVTPEMPEAGQEVTVRVVATDPDAAVTTNGGTHFFADPHDHGAQIGFPYVVEKMPERFGPWTPPARTPGWLEMSFTHTFSQPGDFEFFFGANSGDEADPGNQARNPYSSAQQASVRITVKPPSEVQTPA